MQSLHSQQPNSDLVRGHAQLKFQSLGVHDRHLSLIFVKFIAISTVRPHKERLTYLRTMSADDTKTKRAKPLRFAMIC